VPPRLNTATSWCRRDVQSSADRSVTGQPAAERGCTVVDQMPPPCPGQNRPRRTARRLDAGDAAGECEFTSRGRHDSPRPSLPLREGLDHHLGGVEVRYASRSPAAPPDVAGGAAEHQTWPSFATARGSRARDPGPPTEGSCSTIPCRDTYISVFWPFPDTDADVTGERNRLNTDVPHCGAIIGVRSSLGLLSASCFRPCRALRWKHEPFA